MNCPSAHHRCPSIGKIVKLSLIGLIGALVNSTSVSAALFEVTTEAGLRTAIVTSLDTQDEDTIDLQGSTIVTNSEIVIAFQNSGALTITNGTLNGIGTAEGLASHRLIKVEDLRVAPSALASINFENMAFVNGNYNPAVIPQDRGERGGAALLLLDVSTTITDSRFANNTSTGNLDGGAINMLEGEAVITRSEFTNNSAIAAGISSTIVAGGGAIATREADSFKVINSSFRGNSATQGGAISILGSRVQDVISQSSFIDNDSDNFGGAIWARSGFDLNTSTFYNNFSGIGGGAVFFQQANVNSNLNTASPSISHNTFVENIAGNSGGDSIFVSGSSIRPSIYSNIFLGNADSNSSNCSASNIPVGVSTFFDAQLNISDDATCGSNTLVGGSVAEFFTTNAPIDNSAQGTVQTTRNFALKAGLAATDAITAIDTGGQPGAVTCPTTQDQRGFGRVDTCDVGSFELQTSSGDIDGDGVSDAIDNCVYISNDLQFNTDVSNDGGNACDDDDDNDGQTDADETFCGSDPQDGDSISPDDDWDGVPDCLDSVVSDDTDSDGVSDLADNCPSVGNAQQINTDGDELGDACDLDDDGDRQSDANELFCVSDPLDANSTSPDLDDDGIPDCADLDFEAGVEYRLELLRIGTELAAIRAVSDGETSTVLNRSVFRVRFALRDSRWADNSTLAGSRGTVMFNIMSRALSDIELAINLNPDNSFLLAQLNGVANAILENLRQLAVDEVDRAVEADGRVGAIGRANAEFPKADASSSEGAFEVAATQYRNAWRIANRSF